MSGRRLARMNGTAALSLSDGSRAVKLARTAVELQARREPLPEPPADGVFGSRRGVFVTINSAAEGEDRLRGCIGYPYPVKPLGEALVAAAAAAASEDPRFPPLSGAEAAEVVLEVSVLTQPRPLTGERGHSFPSKVRVGTDGLIVSGLGTSGLLLPQVATEFRMGAMEFLSQTCMKAGLRPDAWLDGRIGVEVFQAQVFAEERPSGDVLIRV